MQHRRLNRLRRELRDLRQRGGIRAAVLERLATRVGRERHSRGKEPVWVNRSLPRARPVAIPSHPGDLNRFTARNILDQLEEDIDMLEERLERED